MNGLKKNRPRHPHGPIHILQRRARAIGEDES
jgi:hypothetical protein